jgi:hypothetical protein
MVSEYKGRTRFIRLGRLAGHIRHERGTCYGIEVKGPKGKQADAQKEFQAARRIRRSETRLIVS